MQGSTNVSVCVMTADSLLPTVTRVLVEACLTTMGGRRLDSSGSSSGQVAGCYDYGNKHLGFIKCEEFLD